MLGPIRETCARIRAFARRRALDRELAEELDTHLSLLADEYVRRGMTIGDATRAARLRLGAPASLAEQHRAVRGLPAVETILQDLGFAFRLIARDRWFSAAAIATLALGIGANAVGFTIVNAALLRALPFEDSGRLYTMSWQNRSGRRSNVTAAEFQEWRARIRAFDGLAAYVEGTANVSDDRALPDQVQAVRVTSDVFAVLRQPPLIGRIFEESDARPGSAPVAIVAYAVWQNRYGGDAGVLGKTLRVNGTPATIVGVMPDRMKFPDNAEIWTPLAASPAGPEANRRVLRVFGRLRKGVDRRQAHAELSGIALQQVAEDRARRDLLGVRVETFSERFIGGAGRPMVLMVMASVMFVLLIACANVANMLLSRSAFRVREMAVRAAIGATRGRLVRHLLIESLVLALFGGVLGLGLAVGGVKVFAAVMAASGFPYWVVFTVDYVVIGYVAAICMLTAVFSGLAPALRMSKAGQDALLKETGRGSIGGPRERSFSGTLIVAELALTVILLAGSAVMVRSFLTLYAIDIGVDTRHLMTMDLELPASKYRNAAARRGFLERLEPRLAAIPGVEAAAVTTGVPSRDGGERLLEIDSPAGSREPVFVSTVIITPRFFGTVGVPIVRGRNFTAADGAPGAETVIVNEALAARFFPGEEAIGKRLRFTQRVLAPSGSKDVWRTIVGIGGRILHGSSLDLYENAVVYIPYRQETPAAVSLLVRSALPLAAVMGGVRRVVQAMDPDQPVVRVETLSQVLARDRWWYRTWGGLFAIFATIAVVLSSIGLYAVLAYAVTRRTHEIGLRMAVGAQPRQIAWLILQRALGHLAIGVGIGIAGALALNRVMRLGVAETGPNDPATFASIALLLTLVCVAACLVPVRRATRIDPVVALRAE